MTALAPTLQAFFTDRLARQRRASPHTVAAYRDTLRLLIGFVCQTTGKKPSRLGFEDLNAEMIGTFLDHIETERHNTTRTRNARLAAIRSLFRYAAFRHPEHAALIAQVLAIPQKRTDKSAVSFLARAEIDALLASPDQTNRIGRRDHALLVVGVQCGLRVSELTGLNCGDVHLDVGPHITCRGKGRKQRATPLTATTVKVLRIWLAEINGAPDTPLFSTSTGRRLTRDAVARRVAKHAATAASRCPSLAGKQLSPHTLRHSNAMELLHAGVDTSVIALWLGHEGVESTQMYLHADMSIKERAIARTTPTDTRPGRYRPPEPLLAFLESL
jgi:site-specific recombinase XerD